MIVKRAPPSQVVSVVASDLYELPEVITRVRKCFEAVTTHIAEHEAELSDAMQNLVSVSIYT